MRYVVQTWWQEEGAERDPKIHGFYAFKESAEHAGQMLTKANGREQFRMFSVLEVTHPGPQTLSEWLMKVREEIERQFTAVYNVDEDKFYDSDHYFSADADDAANAAYKGAKIAMQLLEVQ